ncbi:MAG: Ubiquinone biosynthesis O-methyltransferase [Prosthecobacter sp.]|nr:Ubiquinone biosynthesis O-methyltransferase [Prosthecobacter sp.]
MLPRRLLQQLRPLICPLEPLLVQMPRRSRVLDIGCGTGALLLRAVKEDKVAQGLGIDVNKAALETARETWQAMRDGFPHAGLVFMPSDELPDTAGPWQVVTLIDVIHHVPRERQEAFLREAFRRVAPGGRMIYKDVCLRPWWKRAMNRLHDLVMARQWISEVPLEKVRLWAGQEGLKVVEEQHYGRLWYGHELLVMGRDSFGD